MMAVTQNNVYVHSNPPKAISGQGAAIRNWVKNGDLERLESVVLEGQGARLLGLMESTGDAKVKAFLKSIPGYMAKVDLIHDAVIRGSLRETQGLIDKRKLATARDAVGRGVAHKAVLYNHRSLLEWMAKKYPETIHLKDNEGRSCLHYTAANKEPEELFDLLVSLGANPDAIDIHGRKPGYYVNHPEELDIEGPYNHNNNNNTNSRSFSRGNRLSRRISPISPKSTGSVPSSMNITRAQIRIWIHERDITKLERIVWSGNGDKLLLETTNNSKVRRFLDNVPHLLSRIKSIHTAAIHNDINSLKQLKDRTEIDELFTAKDGHGLTPLHKAAGLGNRTTVEYLLYEVPSMLNEVDNEGRTALHYASRDSSMYSFLTRAGADENVQDKSGKTPSYYRAHPNDLDAKHLRNIPDAPRVSGELSGWERGMSPQVAGIAAAAAATAANNKRKISTGEFGGDSEIRNDKEQAERDVIEDRSPSPKKRDSSNMRYTSGTKFRRTEEVDDEIDDVNDGYVADSDEGKYELSTDFEIQPMEEELDDLDKELQAIGNESSNNGTPYDLDAPDGRLSNVKSAAEEMIAEVEEAAEEQVRRVSAADPSDLITSDVVGEEGLSDIQQPNMEDDVPEQEAENTDQVPAQEEDMGEEVKGHSGVKQGNKTPSWESEYPNLVSDDPIEPKEDQQEMDTMTTTEAEVLREAKEVEDGLTEATELLEASGIPEGTELPEVVQHDVDAYVNNGDMEKLVEMVLDGQGGQLVDKQSSSTEVQEFLVNVPAYMAKIASIHAAAGSGNLRDLQSLLDRKRLAQAKDEMGRVPMHQAVLNGHSNVTRYLASNYPQSLNMMDMNKRSPLHYAATLPDQGALYKVLIQAGADPNLKDVDGNTPGIYLRRKDLLTQSDLVAMTPHALMEHRSGKRKESTVDTWERPPTPAPPYEAPLMEADAVTSADYRQVPLCDEKEIPVVDLPSKFVSQVRLRLSRNIRPYPFVSILRKEVLAEIEAFLSYQIAEKVADWDVVHLDTLEKEERDELVETRELWIPEATKISRFWPKSRSCYINPENTMTIWINGQDHLDLFVSSRYGRLGSMLNSLNQLYGKITNDLEFHYNSQTGFLTVDPFRCGTGLKITFRLRLPHLMKSRSELTSECDNRNLFIKWSNRGGEDVHEIPPDDWIELENIRTFGCNENEIAHRTAEAVNELIKMEEGRARAVDLAATAPKKP